jgi:hypothetical protein
MKLSRRQKEIVYGLILGDAYIQKTGKQNARFRLEHSIKQKEYMDWLYRELENLFAHKPNYLKRVHPKTKNTNEYVRLQSNAMPWFGKLRKVFYGEQGKFIPEQIDEILKSSLTLAVWYMDDGHYYSRDKSAHIYLQKYSQVEQERLLNALKKNFSINACIYCRPDREACQINITGKNLNRFVQLVKPHMAASMLYKLPLDPVSTESEN